MLQDFRFGLRALRRSPLITAVAVVTLGLGIGGASAVFSVVEAVLLRPLPFRDPDRLVRVWELTREGGRFSFSEPNYLDLRAQSRTLGQVAAYGDVAASAVVREGGEPERIGVTPVSASLTQVLGVQPAHGRMFTEAEDRPGTTERPIVLSDRIWRQRFGADPALVGATVRVDGMPSVVTGIMPPGFDFPGRSEAWIPLRANPRSERDNKALAVIGRLRPGVTMAQLLDDLRRFARQLSDTYADANGGWSADAATFSDWIVAAPHRDAIWILFGAVGVLLLLACANVANLLLAYGTARRAEMQLRSALGASRVRLVRQLLTEAALLAALGTLAGILAASWSLDILRTLGADRVPRLDGLRIHAPILLFASLAGATSCLIFGLLPALHASRVDLRTTVENGLRYTARSTRLRHTLVVVEVALALLLLVGAGLLASSFARLMRVDPGFQTKGVLAVPIELPYARYAPDRAAAFYAELLERTRTLPGVLSAGATSTNPFRQFGFSNSITAEERAAEAPSSGMVRSGWRSVTPGFFETMRIRLVSGRSFDGRDRQGAERVVVVSERLAQQLWPGEPAVGKRIYWGGNSGPTRTVIGVVADIRDVQLESEPRPILYLPHQQLELPSMTILVRTTAAASAAPAVRDIVRVLDGSLPPPSIDEVESGRTQAVAGPRFNLWLLGAFAAIAVALAATGVYAMLAFSVAQRRREIAVRLALGADPPGIRRLVLRNGLGLAVTGVVAGTVAALAATRVLSSLLFGVGPTDPLTFTAAALALLGVATLACYLPARHASRLDPIVILRN